MEGVADSRRGSRDPPWSVSSSPVLREIWPGLNLSDWRSSTSPTVYKVGGIIRDMAPLGYPPEAEMSQPSGIHVRAEEVGLVLLVLLLWAGAVALFFNRWGKIRMLEPYQPKFNDAPRGSVSNGTVLATSNGHRTSYPLVEYNHQPRLHSRMNMSFGDYSDTMVTPAGRRRAPSFLMASSNGGSSSLRDDFSCGHRSHCGSHMANHRPRQNSVVVFATSHFMTSARKVKSAMDLQTLVLREETEENVHAMTHLSPSSSVSPCHQRDNTITELPDIHSSPSYSHSQITSV